MSDRVLSFRRVAFAAMRGAGCCAIAIAVFFFVGAVSAADNVAPEGPNQTPEMSAPVTPFVFDGDVRDLPASPQWKPGDPVKEIPRRRYFPPGSEGLYADPELTEVDLLWEAQRFAPDSTSGAFTTPSRNFAGLGYTGVNPPDTVGEVGPSHYIQMVNSGGGADVRIFDKAEPTPNTLASFRLDSLGSSNCASGYGDPIVLYDRLADRWLMSEFSSSGNRLCVYISQSGDPVSGGWYNYAYTAPSFPDYPKYGVWPTDANGGQGSYVVAANDGGPGIYALNRGAMLTGSPGTYQRISMGGLPGFPFEGPAPADLDGPTAPPTGAPAMIMRHRDTEVHSGPAAPADLLEIWEFDVDWNTPSNTTLVQAPSVDVAEFDSSLCGLSSFFCFPMPGTSTRLDPLREVIMNRLQYMNQGSYETLTGNFVVDLNGSDHGGLRWFELRRQGGGGWTLYQEGTYSIDSDHRWMAASSMDSSGNIAIAYSVSSTSTYPSLRYTGRLSSDPPGVMTQAETSIHAGTASNSSNRWGDYASMNLDPEDDCTFWFTSLDNTSSNWRTQIASFGFDACGCAQLPAAPTASATTVGDNRIDVSWNDSDLRTVVEYRVQRSMTHGGSFDTIAVVADTSPLVPNGPGYTYEDTTVSGGTTYFYRIVSSDGEACTSEPSNETNATATGACTLPPTFDGLLDVSTPYEVTCLLDLEWDNGLANCAGPIVYNIYRSLDPDFVPDLTTRIVADFPGTSYTDANALDTDVPYYYIVRAVDTSSGVEDGNLIALEGVAQGPLSTGTWIDDAGDTGDAKMIRESPWSVNGSEGNLGPAVYKTGSYGNNLCSGLATPELQLGSGSVLRFASRYSIENGWDKGEVQISTDGGGSWERVEMNYPTNSNRTADACGLSTGTYFTGTNNTWANYTANLSNWSGEGVQLRFALSTDSSQNGSGWWIDDISITNVDVPSECVPGSSCSSNPFVDVRPDGLIEECEGAAQTLTAQLTGGEGPFYYQWTRDGFDIPGETGPTFEANETGSHLYNVRVHAEACVDETTDVAFTQISWQGAPDFNGITAAGGAPGFSCAVDLAWQPAETICPGPITYTIYRSTSSPVAPTIENRVASGLTGTSHQDDSALVNGATYHYLVRAVDQSNGLEDTNVAQRSAMAGVAPGTGFPCTTIQPAPPPVPDGSESPTPLGGSRATYAGDVIDVTWDAATCPAPMYNLLYGDLDDVAVYALSGSQCGIGSSGSYTWTEVPDTSLFFLIVGADGGTTESSWGTDSELEERNGMTASGECGGLAKSTANSCP